MRKKRAAIVCVLAAVLLLAGCGGGFDADRYVLGVLNNIYLGDSTEYREMVDITEEEAAEEYEQGIEIEADFSCSIMELAKFPMRFISRSWICIKRFINSQSLRCRKRWRTAMITTWRY